jgi:enoyl-CoA hydratase/carnithine racemase
VEVFAKALDRLEQLRIPTIAAVQGRCMGGGFELALSCDLIIAERSASFSFPEASLGILTLQGGVIQLAERVGRAKAVELVLLSERISADQMATWNVINHVVNEGDLSREVEAIAERLAAGPHRAYAATKALLHLWSLEGSKGAKSHLYDLSMPLFDTEDVQTALRLAADAIVAGKPLPKTTL